MEVEEVRMKEVLVAMSVPMGDVAPASCRDPMWGDGPWKCAGPPTS